MTVKEAAKRLKLTERAVRYRLAKGKLKGKLVGDRWVVDGRRIK